MASFFKSIFGSAPADGNDDDQQMQEAQQAQAPPNPPAMQQQMQMPQQMMQQQQCMGMGGGGLFAGGGGTIQEIPQDAAEGAELAAVIVTVRSGGTYDDLFARVKQKAAEGTRVSCYLVCNHSPAALQAALEGTGGGDTAARMRADIAAVDPASVVVNWECCGGCSGDSFHGGAPTALMAALLARGFMVMASDFSLGALVAQWDAAALGANPFKKVGEFGQQMTLRFDPAVLAACDDSAQLQMLGELCASGEAHVHAMGGTKAYTVDAAVTPAAHPAGAAGWTSLQVLTIVTKAGGRDPSSFTRAATEACAVGEHRGLAGHVLLRYPSGGRLLASCPHWIELSKLDVNAEQLLHVAEQRYGAAYAGEMRSKMAGFGGGAAGKRAKAAYVSAQSCAFVQQSAPAKYSKKKGGGKKG